MAIATVIVLNHPPISHAPMLVVGLLCVGFLLVVTAVMGRLWCSLYLCGYKNRLVIDTGPYSIVRNPLYLFSLAGALGIGVASLSVLVTALIMVFFLAMFRATAAREEGRLTALFGERYKRYCAKTPRFLPDFSLYQSSPDYTINVRQMNSAFLDVVWFLVVFMLVACLPMLRVLHWLPSLMKWP